MNIDLNDIPIGYSNCTHHYQYNEPIFDAVTIILMILPVRDNKKLLCSKTPCVLYYVGGVTAIFRHYYWCSYQHYIIAFTLLPAIQVSIQVLRNNHYYDLYMLSPVSAFLPLPFFLNFFFTSFNYHQNGMAIGSLCSLTITINTNNLFSSHLEW